MFYDGGHWGMGFSMIAVFVGFFLLIYLFVKVVAPNNGPHKETPLDILKKRFAKGELTEEEYKIMKKKLEML